MRRPTLTQLFVLAAIAVAAIVVVAFGFFVRSARANVLRSATDAQALAAKRIEARVVRELGRARRALDDVEHGIHAGAIDPADPTSLESNLFTRLSADAHLVEITFTRAALNGYLPNGDADLAPNGRSQISVERTRIGSIRTREVKQDDTGGPFVVITRERPADARFDATLLHPTGHALDPTRVHTFTVAAAKENKDVATWSDLHWSDLDEGLPQEQQRVVVSVQKTVEDGAGVFLGVLRVAIITSELDDIGRIESTHGEPEDVGRVVLLALPPSKGTPRLLARVSASDHMVVDPKDDEIRVASDHPPPEVAALLASNVVRGLDLAHPNAEGSLVVGGVRWVATLRAIELEQHGGTTGWMVAVLAPEDRYTTDLGRFEKTFVITFGSTFALVAIIAITTLIFMRRGLAHISNSTHRMRAFDFAQGDERSAFRDVDDVMVDLERAKTVVRVMGKYVPVDLVRKLYDENVEPKLGGEPSEISIMFTDIEGFTTIAETLPPAELARRLGDYLEVMTDAIERTEGTIDKFVGDAVMALWNAPNDVPEHAKKACRAALACMEAADALYRSKRWEGLPPLVTRFGINTDRVLVGHFGAPSRIGYTALGDGVNLAARLEPLCKQYGVVVLVSENVVKQAEDAFSFRRVDRVAVKGKTHGIDVYELLGAKGDAVAEARVMRAKDYEKAFDAYLERRFTDAAELLEPHIGEDPPSAVLRARCLALAAAPPPAGWSGVHVAVHK